MALVDPARGAIIENTHVTQLTGLVRGDAGKGQLIRLYRYEDAADYANILGNVDTTNGLAVKIQYGAVASPVTLATFAKAGVTLQSADATRSLVISNSGVAITAPSASFSVNGQTFNRGIAVYNVLDHGIVQGLTSTPAAANSAALIALATTVAAAGGGVIYFPGGGGAGLGTYPLNALSLDHARGSTASISLVGDYGATALHFFGTAGPFLDLGDGAANALHRCGLKNLTIQHNDTVLSGPTVRIGADCSQVELDHVNILGGTSLINVEVVGGVNIRACKLVCQDAAAGRNVITSYGGVSSVPLYIVDSDLSGGHGTSTGIEFSLSTGMIDGVLILGTYIKDHDIAIKSGASTGDVVNMIIGDSVLDVVNIGISFQPQTGAAYSSIDISNLWVSADETGFMFNESNGGTVDDIGIHGGRITDVETCGIEVLDGITDVIIDGVRIFGGAIAGAAEAGIMIGAGATSPTNVIVANNIVKVAGTAAASIQVHSAVDVVGVVGNLSRGVDVDFNPVVGTARVYQADANPFKA
jgi:hypothetical protein